MAVKEGGVRRDIKVAGLSNWRNDGRYIKRWQEDRKDGRKIRFGGNHQWFNLDIFSVR